MLISVKTVLAAPLCEGKNVIEAKGDILIVPQATLGGKLKGKSLQYVPLTDRPTLASQVIVKDSLPAQ